MCALQENMMETKRINRKERGKSQVQVFKLRNGTCNAGEIKDHLTNGCSFYRPKQELV